MSKNPKSTWQITKKKPLSIVGLWKSKKKKHQNNFKSNELILKLSVQANHCENNQSSLINTVIGYNSKITIIQWRSNSHGTEIIKTYHRYNLSRIAWLHQYKTAIGKMQTDANADNHN